METFSALLAICAGKSPVKAPHKGQWRGALMLSLICAWTHGWVTNGGAVDLRRHPVHYGVTVITGGHRTRVAAVTLDNMAEDAVAASASFAVNSHRVCSLLRPILCESIVNVMGHIDAKSRAAVIRYLAAIPA